MTDEEKIEQILSRMENGYEFNPSSSEMQLLELDMKWLINYAKSTSKRINELKVNEKTSRENSRRTRKENKLYRGAIEEIAREMHLGGDSHYATQQKLIRVIMKAREAWHTALEGEN